METSLMECSKRWKITVLECQQQLQEDIHTTSPTAYGTHSMGPSGGMNIAGAVEVEILHGDHLGVTPASGAPLDPEGRPEGPPAASPSTKLLLFA